MNKIFGNIFSYAILIAVIFLPSIEVSGQSKLHEGDTLKIGEVKYKVAWLQPTSFELSRIGFENFCDDDFDWNRVAEDDARDPDLKDCINTHDAIVRPVITEELKKQIFSCFTSKEIAILSKDVCSYTGGFTLRLFPRGSCEGKILGFHTIKIHTGGSVPYRKLLKMKFLERTLKFLEEKMSVNDHGFMKRYNGQYVNSWYYIGVSVEEDGNIRLFCEG